MRQSRKVLEAIDSYIHNNPLISSNDATDFVIKIADIPDFGILQHRYGRQLFNSRIKRFRDKHGVRSVFSTADKLDPYYVNVEMAVKNPQPGYKEYFVSARHSQEKLYKQVGRNVRKLRRGEMVMDGQLSIDEFYDLEEPEE